jgi:hypothetical protein
MTPEKGVSPSTMAAIATHNMLLGSYDTPAALAHHMVNGGIGPNLKGSIESDNLMSAMLSSRMSPVVPGLIAGGKRNSGTSIFDMAEHRSENDLSLVGGGHLIDEVDNSANQEEAEEEDPDESKGSVKIVFEDPMIVEKMPRCIIHPQTHWKTVWNIVMLLLIIFIAITVPYRISFEDQTPPVWLYTDIIIDMLFIIDVSMNFFTAIEDDNGELCTDHKKIIMSYVKTWLIVDIISSIPISLIQKLTAPAPSSDPSADGGSGGLLNVRIIKLSRLPRLYRLLRLLKLMRIYKSNKFIERISMQLNMSVTTSRLMKSFIMVFFLLHLVGCLWVTVAVMNPYDDPENW